MVLTDLPRDVLLLIFAYCDFETLLTIAQVCRLFNDISSHDSLWRPVLKKCVNSNGHFKSNNKWILKDYCRLSVNWVRGLYSEKILVNFHTRLLPWLQLNRNRLFVSEGNQINIFNINRQKRNFFVPVRSINCGKEDVERFVVRKDMVVSGCMGKTVKVWQIKNNCEEMSFSGHSKLVCCVDICNETVLSGSKDLSIKMWSLQSGECVKTIPVGDPVRSLAMNPNKRIFAAGSSGFLARRIIPLRLYDCETGCGIGDLVCETSRKNGFGVVDIKFDSANILLSCGYDTAVRLWDIRNNSRRCVKKWEDLHDSAVYCIDSDRKWTILSGTNRYGLVRLWDKRMEKCLKNYNVNRGTRSPVYSLRFNHTKLFVALDNRVNVLNFEPRSR